jgi:hypothetical protein
MTAVYQKIPVPGYEKGDTYTDPELLASTVGYRKWGATIAGGQGILTAGTALAQKASDKKYYVYDNASGTLGVAVALLYRGVDTGVAGSPDQQGNILTAGEVKLSMVSGADAAAITDLKAKVDTIRGTFTF